MKKSMLKKKQIWFWPTRKNLSKYFGKKKTFKAIWAVSVTNITNIIRYTVSPNYFSAATALCKWHVLSLIQLSEVQNIPEIYFFWGEFTCRFFETLKKTERLFFSNWISIKSWELVISFSQWNVSVDRMFWVIWVNMELTHKAPDF